MTHRKIRTTEDGTRIYADYHRYTPKPLEERKYRINKPDDPRAVRFHGQWFLPLELLPDERREMPPTREDSEAYDHMSISVLCNCDVCRRPAAERWRRKWRVDQGLRA